MESKLDSWNDPYGCRDVSLAEDVISELQDTIESQAAEIAFEETRVADLMNILAKQDRDIAELVEALSECNGLLLRPHLQPESDTFWRKADKLIAKHKEKTT